MIDSTDSGDLILNGGSKKLAIFNNGETTKSIIPSSKGDRDEIILETEL